MGRSQWLQLRRSGPRWLRSLACCAWASALGLRALPAAAQQLAEHGAAPAPPAAEQAPAATEGSDAHAAAAAQAAFQRATELYAQGDVAGALGQYEQAYTLLPRYQVLYNIAAMNLQLGRRAEARRAIELYLKLGGPQIPAERSAQLQSTLQELERKTATLTLTTNVAPDEVVIDARPVESHELTGLVLEPGAHVLRISKPGFRPEQREVIVKEGQQLHLVLQLWPVAPAPVAALPASPVPYPAQSYPLPAAQPAPASPGARWLPWAVTGTLAAGWVTTSLLALQARQDRDALEQRPDTSSGRIDEGRRVHLGLAVASDVLLAATLGAAGVSAYLTWWSGAAPAEALPSASRRSELPRSWGVSATGHF